MATRYQAHPQNPPPEDVPPAMSKRRVRRIAAIAVVVGALVVLAGFGTVATNAFGVGTRFENLVERVRLVVDPPPDRPIVATIDIDETPSPEAPSPVLSPSPQASPGDPSVSPSAMPSPSPSPSPSPAPVRRPVDVALDAATAKDFNSQMTKDWCAPAGVQITLAIQDLAPASDKFQRELAGRIDEWESKRDSKNGGWGPSAIVQALAAYGADGYEIHAHKSRAGALRDAARALSASGKPVILIAWRGAHTWVMTGYRADADPLVFDDAVIKGTYIFDPWYPRISTIWGPSDPPGTYQDAAEMKRNFLPWKRPEGTYADRDGKYLIVVPTTPVG